MFAGSAIKDLEVAYNNAGEPVLFLEQYVHTISPVYPTRYYRWWTAYGSGDTVYYPMVMIDSGNQISSGPLDYATAYKSIIDSSLIRNPKGSITATSQRVGDHYHFEIQVTNSSGTPLSSANGATIHAIVYETDATTVATGVNAATNTCVRAGINTPVSPLIADGETGSFSLDTPDLTGVENWANLHSLVIVDYRPNGASGPYDTLQAAFESNGDAVSIVPILVPLLLEPEP